MSKNFSLQTEVAAKYKVVNWPFPTSKAYFGSHGTIDLNTVSLKKVESLVKAGCPYFAPVSKAVKATEDKK